MSGNDANDDLEGADIWGESSAAVAAPAPEAEAAAPEADEGLDDETRHMSNSELRQRIHLLDNDIRIMRSDIQRITHESHAQRDRIRENMEKVKVNKQLPYLVGNVVEVLEPEAEDGKTFSNANIPCVNYPGKKSQCPLLILSCLATVCG
jgi:ATP-dependent 26S proteasome regulatory subunit